MFSYYRMCSLTIERVLLLYLTQLNALLFAVPDALSLGVVRFLFFIFFIIAARERESEKERESARAREKERERDLETRPRCPLMTRTWREAATSHNWTSEE